MLTGGTPYARLNYYRGRIESREETTDDAGDGDGPTTTASLLLPSLLFASLHQSTKVKQNFGSLT